MPETTPPATRGFTITREAGWSQFFDAMAEHMAREPG
jgi:hypothetical protein